LFRFLSIFLLLGQSLSETLLGFDVYPVLLCNSIGFISFSLLSVHVFLSDATATAAAVLVVIAIAILIVVMVLVLVVIVLVSVVISLHLWLCHSD